MKNNDKEFKIMWEGNCINSKLIKAFKEKTGLANGKWEVVDIYAINTWEQSQALPCVGLLNIETSELKFFSLLTLLPELNCQS